MRFIQIRYETTAYLSSPITYVALLSLYSELIMLLHLRPVLLVNVFFYILNRQVNTVVEVAKPERVVM